jgi:hypothetical protein
MQDTSITFIKIFQQTIQRHRIRCKSSPMLQECGKLAYYSVNFIYQIFIANWFSNNPVFNKRRT